MFTRKQYLNKECSHREYYAQFVDAYVIDRVQFIIGKDKILNSADEAFNDIPLAYWDSIRLYHHVSSAVKRAGDTMSLAGQVCIAKEAAKQIREYWDSFAIEI